MKVIAKGYYTAQMGWRMVADAEQHWLELGRADEWQREGRVTDIGGSSDPTDNNYIWVKLADGRRFHLIGRPLVEDVTKQ